jgi:hypothetical protein
MEMHEQSEEPFIFSLIREHLPHDDQEGGDHPAINNRLGYWSMALATVGIMVSWLLCGIAPTR